MDLVRWTQRLTAESARGLWSTFSNIIDLPESERAAFLDELTELFEEFGGAVEDPRVTALYRIRRRPYSHGRDDDTAPIDPARSR